MNAIRKLSLWITSPALVLTACVSSTGEPPQEPTDSSAAMGPRSPEELMHRYRELVHQRDLDGLVELYEPDATFIPAPGASVTGRAAIRDALAGILALSPTMETKIEEVHRAADLALVHVTWQLRGTAPDGTPVTQQGRSADVLRVSRGGQWRVAIDHP